MNTKELAFSHLKKLLTDNKLTPETAAELAGENVRESTITKAQEFLDQQAERAQKRLDTMAARAEKRAAKKADKEPAAKKAGKAKGAKSDAKKSPAKGAKTKSTGKSGGKAAKKS